MSVAEYLVNSGPMRFMPKRMAFANVIANNGDMFEWKGVPFPSRDEFNVPATETVTGVIKVTPGSVLVSMTGYCSLASGFMFSVYDKEANYWLFSREYDFWRNQLGDMDGMNVGCGQRWLEHPYVVLGKGELQISVTNLSNSAAAIVQVMLQFAERSGIRLEGGDGNVV